MALWTEPLDWSPEYLRSQIFNQEIRDKQNFLFKRPREIVTIASAGSLAVPTSLAFIDEVGFVTDIETTGRPLLLTITGSVTTSVATANRQLWFDCKVGDRYSSGIGATLPLTNGAYTVWLANTAALAAMIVPFEVKIMIDWLTTPDIYRIKPMWAASASTTINTTQAPLEMTIEEL